MTGCRLAWLLGCCAPRESWLLLALQRLSLRLRLRQRALALALQRQALPWPLLLPRRLSWMPSLLALWTWLPLGPLQRSPSCCPPAGCCAGLWLWSALMRRSCCSCWVSALCCAREGGGCTYKFQLLLLCLSGSSQALHEQAGSLSLPPQTAVLLSAGRTTWIAHDATAVRELIL